MSNFKKSLLYVLYGVVKCGIMYVGDTFMKLYYDRKSIDPTYFVQQGFRNGKKTSTRNIFRIGKHSELLKEHSDPLEYAKSIVSEYNEKNKSDKLDINILVDFAKKLTTSKNMESKSTLLNVGYFFLQDIYSKLNLKDFFKEISKDRKYTFNCNDINRFLTFDRILAPKSKYAALGTLSNYFEQPDFEYQHILRFMDILNTNYDSYLTHLYKNSENIVSRDTSVCYYDCTNYYFEIEQDDDYIDDVTGEVCSGFRKFGPSKEHRPNPLVEMGLFMDKNGIPITMGLYSGNTNEQKTVKDLENKMIRMLNNKKIIYCADAGLGSASIRTMNDIGGRAFIVTQSVKKLNDSLQDIVFSDTDYKLLSSDKSVTLADMKSFDKYNRDNLNLYQDIAYKVIDVDSNVDLGLFEEKTCKNGKVKTVKSKAILKQRIIVTFSRKMMEYQRKIRNGQIERAKALIKSNGVEDKKKGPNDITRFVKSSQEVKNTYEIDNERIALEEKYDGFYAIATNLMDDSVKEIFEINSQRYKIEDCFRVLKTNFDARPVYHRLESRIVSHFMICYTALLIYRLLEKKLKDYDSNSNFTITNIIQTLKNMNVSNRDNLFYEADYTSSSVCTALNGLFDLGLDKKYYKPLELSKKLKKIL